MDKDKEITTLFFFFFFYKTHLRLQMSFVETEFIEHSVVMAVPTFSSLSWCTCDQGYHQGERRKEIFF